LLPVTDNDLILEVLPVDNRINVVSG